MKGSVLSLVATESPLSSLFDALMERSSSWQRLVRVTAYVLRFIHNARKTSRRPDAKTLSFDETKEARILWLQQAQSCFQEDIKQLKRNDEVSSHSKLLQLAPFVDEFGLLRVGGRIRNSELPTETQHPVILPKEHRATQLILIDEHIRNLHPGVSALFVIVRQRYWILGARNLIRKITHNCIKCYRQKRTSTQQFLADLPAIRVRQAHPFQHIGVDYAGPLTLNK
ncbi:PREDICTED: uncharacterized protein LOC108367325 [Rhagoletis zephyria]|uniref:uncharacterized protein LOC108367325 n=1 Tax=Rhagoletis zephyria TaxID=28612 RepID=UPI0008119C4D|nr:PREDICTED: uncharacterized protein LOC108367325 [Rhagoletis zephyria]